MTTTSRQASCELDRFIASFEAARTAGRNADPADFLPGRGHPLYLEALRELVRVDLEFGWDEGRACPLSDYLERFPDLLRDTTALQAVAFEEYRLRRAAGQDPVPEEYAERYRVSVADWPPRKPASQLEEAAASYRAFRKHQSQDDAPDLFPWSESAEGGTAPDQFFKDLHGRDPRAAERLAEGVLTLPAVGADFLGFQLLEELGRGAFGRVFLARQGELAGRLVALKVSPDAGGESQTLAQLQHTHIVPIHSLHTTGPFQAVCMPYFGRTTLADVLKELAGQEALPRSGPALLAALRTSQRAPAGATACRAPLEGRTYVEAVLWLGRCLADGLAHAHERGILHHDLKPANVLVSDDGQPMLLDFNLAEDTKLRGSASAALVGGTLPYMAPEHLAAFRDRVPAGDARSDIFSLGILLHELLTARAPFPRRQAPAPQPSDEATYACHRPRDRQPTLEEVLDEMIRDRQQGPPSARRWNRDISPAADAIVRRCLEPDPSRRYQTARALQADLQRQLDRLPLAHTREPSLRERAQKWLHHHPRLLVKALAAGAVALLVVAVCLSFRAERLAAAQEALRVLEGFGKDARAAQATLNAWRDEAEQRARGAALGRQALARYGILEDDRWRDRPAVTALAPEERDRLARAAASLLLALARAQAMPTVAHRGARAQQEADLRAALKLNERAESCYTEGPPPALWLQRADLLRRLGESEAARQCRARAAGAAPRTAQDHYLLAREHVAAGRYREALPLVRTATRLDPRDFWAWFLLGNCHDDLQEDVQAVTCYSVCMALAPDTSWPYFNRGLAHLRQRDYAQAGADFDRVLVLQPDLTEAYVNRALARQGLKRYAEAVADLTRALERGAPSPRVYFMRARARERAGDKDGARRDRAEGLRRHPTDERSWVARGMARLTDDAPGALADFEQALALNPRSRAALQDKAHVLAEKLGRTEEAIRVLDQVLELYPDYVPARAGRGVLHARLGRRDPALDDARAALARDGRPPTRYQIACVYALTSRRHSADRDKALPLLAEALRQGYGAALIARDTDLDSLRSLPEFQRLQAAAIALQAAAAGKRSPH